MLKVEGIGKNVEKAIEDALLQLKTSRDNVDIKIIETGGLFKKAKVLVSISEDYQETYKKHQENKKKLVDEDVKPQPIKEEKPKKAEFKPELKKEAETKGVKIASVKEEKSEQKPRIKEVVKEEKLEKTSLTQERTVETAEVQNEAEIGKAFLENFIKMASLDAVVDMFEDEDEIFYTVLGQDASSLIGFRGECLNSLQFLVSVLNGKNNRKNKRVRLDIDGYREKRKGTLELLAARVAKKVQKTGKQTRLEPMSAYERRIIHTAIQEFEGVSSISRGEEPHRYLIIRKDNKQQVQNEEKPE